MPLTIPPIPNSSEKPPAPDWLLDAAPSARALRTAYVEAAAEVATVRKANAAATTAFREASRTDRDNNYIPLPSVPTDDWRGLREALADGRRASDRAERNARQAWIALADAVRDDENAIAAADAKASQAAQGIIDAYKALVAAYRHGVSVARLTGPLFNTRRGFRGAIADQNGTPVPLRDLAEYIGVDYQGLIREVTQ